MILLITLCLMYDHKEKSNKNTMWNLEVRKMMLTCTSYNYHNISNPKPATALSLATTMKCLGIDYTHKVVDKICISI